MNEMLLQLGKNAKEAENTLRTISTSEKQGSCSSGRSPGRIFRETS